MVKSNPIEFFLYILSVPFAYVGIWIGADRIAEAKNIPYDIPVLRVSVSAWILFVTALIVSQFIKDRHSSLLRLMLAGIIAPVIGYIVLASCEALVWAPEIPYSIAEVFLFRFPLYTARSIPATICACLIALILSRSSFRDSNANFTQKTFS